MGRNIGSQIMNEEIKILLAYAYPQEVGRIFEKGFTGKNGRLKNSNATGIGLYICRRLCEKLRMGIFCESEAGSYTRIILTFPDTDYNRF